jgi:hypothetical protein
MIRRICHFGTILIINLLMQLEPPKTLQRPIDQPEFEKRGSAIRSHIIAGPSKPPKQSAPKDQ